MGSEWTTSTVGEFCPFKYGKGLPQRARVAGLFPVMSSAGVVASHTEPLVKSPGIVIGRKGTAGSVTFAPGPFWPIDTAFYVEDDPTNRDIRFTYYLLKTLALSEMNSDSAVPGLNRENAHAVAVCIPSLAMQAEIASFLGALDDRISLLRETNATLEAIAHALFKSWFVDFDPVRAKMEGRAPEGMDEATATLFPDSFEESELGLVPKGWGVTSLDAVASFLNGLALQKFPPTGIDDLPVIKIAQLRKGDTVGSDLASRTIKPEYVVKNGDVLFSWSGSLEVEIWCGGEGALNQHLFKVTSSDYPKWFYYLWTRQHLDNFRQIAASKATTMGHIQRRHLSDAKVVVASDTVLKAVDEILSPFIERIVVNLVQAQTLATLRDTLLPRLISGQLRLPHDN
ncbi:restriction endonuclease subunit S [Pseudomethylobacillus aquaticus]|uniref:Restriction endonuclease subunit S n=1 Tax=Pseudomethylobacillus aquaticus TaxID=2676064 RepID=A0A3N0V019_9PROT|nr:restriction endonuclease subunit S [Pseudomethylobacillus aquaticus]ROH86156.1 restriction endonuclease subunit S [Pseudomethylobacillus aquaticus]